MQKPLVYQKRRGRDTLTSDMAQLPASAEYLNRFRAVIINRTGLLRARSMSLRLYESFLQISWLVITRDRSSHTFLDTCGFW